MFARRIYLSSLFASAVAARSAARFVSHCEDGSGPWPFDSKGLPTRSEVDLRQANKKTTLYLAGAGMRRKNFYVVTVDVYAVGLGLPQDLISNAIEWANHEGNKGSLTPYILKASTSNSVKASVLLKFVRSVTNSQFIDAFKESFLDCNPSSFQAFEAFMKQAFGDRGLNTNDEVGFYWLSNGQLAFTLNGQNLGSLAVDEVSERLLDVYVDPKRAVSPELVASIEKNVLTVQSTLRA